MIVPLPRKNPKMTYERLREMVVYDPETGIFTRGTAKRNRGEQWVPGEVVRGHRHKAGYHAICLDDCTYMAHRLAWLYVYGEWPPHTIDHVNLVKDDNRIANLRLATNAEQHRNIARTRSNSTGFKGVTYRPRAKKWEANITMPAAGHGERGKHKYLGQFDSPEDAHTAYQAAALAFFGEFARVE